MVNLIQDKTARIRQASRILYKVLKSRYRAEPFLLSHLVTRRCNCRCQTCLWSDDRYSDELCTEEIDRVYTEAKDLGFVMNAIWGGEPLIRDDLPKIVESSKKNGFLTTVITNGYYLTERLGELSDYVDCFIVSIDQIGQRHDKMRRRPRIYERAIHGIEMAKRCKTKVMINSVFSKVNKDAVEDLVQLADELDVSIYLCPIETGLMGRSGFEASKNHLGLDAQQLQDFTKKVMQLKRKAYRINNSLTNGGSLRSFWSLV